MNNNNEHICVHTCIPPIACLPSTPMRTHTLTRYTTHNAMHSKQLVQFCIVVGELCKLQLWRGLRRASKQRWQKCRCSSLSWIAQKWWMATNKYANATSTTTSKRCWTSTANFWRSCEFIFHIRSNLVFMKRCTSTACWVSIMRLWRI